MKTVFEATDLLEAHVLLGLLEQQHIAAFVQGQHLVGGAGEVPVSGLIRVQVNDDDYMQARDIVAEWEATQPAAPPGGVETETAGGALPGIQTAFVARSPWLLFTLGVLTGVLLTLYLLRA